MSKTISQTNLPNVKLTVDSFSVTMSAHSHYRNFNTNSAGGGSSSTASPQTSTLGSGQALDITPSYYTTHMWLRTS